MTAVIHIPITTIKPNLLTKLYVSFAIIDVFNKKNVFLCSKYLFIDSHEQKNVIPRLEFIMLNDLFLGKKKV